MRGPSSDLVGIRSIPPRGVVGLRGVSSVESEADANRPGDIDRGVMDQFEGGEEDSDASEKKFGDPDADKEPGREEEEDEDQEGRLSSSPPPASSMLINKLLYLEV